MPPPLMKSKPQAMSFSMRRNLVRLGAATCIAIALIGTWLHLTSVDERDRGFPDYQGDHGGRPRVKLRQGIIQGVRVHEGVPQSLERFAGIPYAESTAGEARFRPPVAVTAESDEVFDASDYGKRCPALGLSPECSEDCLNLNIHRPKRWNRKKKLPVLVHIHGGSFNSGSGPNRQISNLVGWSSKPMLGITFNYRLGAFGFLPSNITEKEGLLNVGLKDQELLLQWVQENIAAFGGDPDNVTLMGSSAGAHSVGHHLMRKPKSRPLIHKVIIESGGSTARACYTPSNPLHEQQFTELLERVGISGGDVIAKLRELPMEQLQVASDTIFQIYNPSVRWPFQPVIDGPGGFIERPPIEAFRDGLYHKIPILTGFNSNEGSAFAPQSTSTSQEYIDFLHTLLPSLSTEDFKVLDTVYPDPLTDHSSPYVETRPGLGAEYKRLEQTYGHFAYICPVKQAAHYAAPKVPVYMYHFAVNSSVAGGANHGDHNNFVTYNQGYRDFSPAIEQVAGSMMAYWTSFVTTGDPNKVRGRFPDRPQWPRYVKGKTQLVVFGDGNNQIAGGIEEGVAVKVVDDEWAVEECKYWWERTDKFEV